MSTTIDQPMVFVQSQQSLAGGLFRLARPADWIKNVFVLVPVPFALADQGHAPTVGVSVGPAGFCLINSAVYTFNDLCDAEADRLHPRKRLPAHRFRLCARQAALVQILRCCR